MILTQPEFIELASTNSTNDALKQFLCKASFPEFSSVRANYQTNGRGQTGNFWESEDGKNLLFSILIFPNIAADKQFYISKIVASACYNVLNKLIPELQTKWPNDLYSNNYKIGGILIENNLSGNKIRQSVIGIGININQTKFSKELPNPTSLQLITQQKHDINAIWKNIVFNIAKEKKYLDAQNFADIDKRYHKHLLGFGQNRTYIAKGKKFTGKITGTEPSGKLIIKSENGTQSFDFKEIEFTF